jgi:acyl-coenzyme A synthetase/AMP-(fatty) acid ligase
MAIPERFVAVKLLPRNEWGKIDRTRLPEIAKAAGT